MIYKQVGWIALNQEGEPFRSTGWRNTGAGSPPRIYKTEATAKKVSPVGRTTIVYIKGESL